ncbi:MAG: porin family protein [Alistipes sp.]
MKKIILLVCVAMMATFAASAQDKGNWAVGPKIGVYANTGADGAIFGVGAIGRYSITDNWRLEPGVTALLHDGCSVDVNCDVQYLFNLGSDWNIYPLAGLSANDIGGWSCGINVGGGADFSVARNWDISAGVKWMIQTAEYHKNPVVFSLGAAYRF